MLPFSTRQVFLPKFSISKLIDKQAFPSQRQLNWDPQDPQSSTRITKFHVLTASQHLFCKTRNGSLPPTGIKLGSSTIIFIIFRDFLTLQQIFLSPQVKRCAIITYKLGIYELPYELTDALRKDLSKLANVKKVSKPHRMIAQ